jgi:hypothetical protein
MEKKKTLKQRIQKNDDIYSAEEPFVKLNLPANADEVE